MLLNSDAEVTAGALERLVRFMDASPEAGACGPALFYPDGRTQTSCFSHETPWRLTCDMLALGKIFPRSRIFANQRTWFPHDRTAAVDWVMGAALVVRRETIEQVGTLDERFSLHCNESDWCYRMHRAGWRVFFVHDARVVHHCGETRRLENRGMEIQRELVQNEFDYYRKHFGGLGFAWYRLWTVIGFAPRALRYRLRRRHGSPADAALEVFCRGMLRAGWTGDPDQFRARRAVEG
jgi:GT2 family glycosyltransferase